MLTIELMQARTAELRAAGQASRAHERGEQRRGRRTRVAVGATATRMRDRLHRR